MTTSNLSAQEGRDVFDRALSLRDAGDLATASQLLQHLVDGLDPNETRLIGHAHLQLGHIADKRGDRAERERHFRAAVNHAPRLELASLGFFHALDNLERLREAFEEALRYLALRESVGYRELFNGDAYRDGLEPESAVLAERVRDKLAAYRESQRARSVPFVADTVRLRTGALVPERIGALATVLTMRSDAQIGELVRVRFTDGEKAEVPIAFVDHHDI